MDDALFNVPVACNVLANWGNDSHWQSRQLLTVSQWGEDVIRVLVSFYRVPEDIPFNQRAEIKLNFDTDFISLGPKTNNVTIKVKKICPNYPSE